MIRTILRVSWLTLTRDRVALALTFVLPIVFFTIFASVFGGLDPGGLRPVEVALVVGDGTVASTVAEHLGREQRLTTTRVPGEDLDGVLDAVRRGDLSAVVVLPSSWPPYGDTAAVEVHVDRSDPLASGLVQGLVRGAIAAAVAERFGAPREVIPVRLVDALGRTGKRPSIAFFAAGLGVMFLMFAVVGRSSILIDERESGVLSRLIAARVGLPRLLAGHWIFLAGLGVAQVSCMFLWAALCFGLDLFAPRALAGFLLTTAATSAAAAAFGLLLCSLCRTRAQLSGVAIVVVLTLCALGGNMFPSFLMPETLQALGRLTFNHWALAAYQKVFWYERPMIELWPQLAGLVTAAVVFFTTSCLIASRWLRRGGLQP